jgi:hypothetical protein
MARETFITLLSDGLLDIFTLPPIQLSIFVFFRENKLKQTRHIDVICFFHSDQSRELNLNFRFKRNKNDLQLLPLFPLLSRIRIIEGIPETIESLIVMVFSLRSLRLIFVAFIEYRECVKRSLKQGI